MAERGWLGSVFVGASMLLVGVVIGGLGPRAALREARAELAQVDPKRCERMAVGREVARAIATGIAQNEATGTARSVRPPRAEVPPEGVTPPAPARDPATDAVDLPEPDPAEAERARIAADTLDLRRQQALAALREQVRPTPGQLDTIERVVDGMNDELAVIADDLIALIESGEEPTRLDWMIFAADLLDVFIDAETGLADALTDDQLASIDPALIDPFSFVDGRITEPLERFHSGGR